MIHTSYKSFTESAEYRYSSHMTKYIILKDENEENLSGEFGMYPSFRFIGKGEAIISVEDFQTAGDDHAANSHDYHSDNDHYDVN
jgi:hypothetical protein